MAVATEDFDMDDDIKQARSLFELNKRVFAILGVWPVHSTYRKFSVWIIYLLFHLTLLLADLVHQFGDLEGVVLNLTESTFSVMVCCKMLVMRFSRTLVTLMVRIIDGVDLKFFDNHEELQTYLGYNRIAKTFFKLWLTMGIVTAISFNLKCLEPRLKSALRNESLPYVLPHRTRVFFEVTEPSTFWLIWLYQCPMAILSIYLAATIGYVFSLILHVCGKLSVLVVRIKRLDLATIEKDEAFRAAVFRDILEKHLDILEMAQDINGVFGLVLLEELFSCTLLIGLTSYNVIQNVDLEETGLFFTYLSYGCTMLVLIYGYCVAGEYLITERRNS
uniref:Odorant receptor n=1 Tax=Campoletis chlorideae TaxID=219166 RepID=A0A346D461_9HYME|nr:odorant receptor [Campoletis chlorideae]